MRHGKSHWKATMILQKCLKFHEIPKIITITAAFQKQQKPILVNKDL
jgi:hypothetical protein